MEGTVHLGRSISRPRKMNRLLPSLDTFAGKIVVDVCEQITGKRKEEKR